MCGYFGNLHESPAVIELLNRLRIKLPYPQERQYQRRKAPGLITHEDEKNILSEPVWWYQLKWDGKFIPDDRMTTFNLASGAKIAGAMA